MFGAVLGVRVQKGSIKVCSLRMSCGRAWTFWLQEKQPQNLTWVSSQRGNRRDLRSVFRGRTPGPGLRVTRTRVGRNKIVES